MGTNLGSDSFGGYGQSVDLGEIDAAEACADALDEAATAISTRGGGSEGSKSARLRKSAVQKKKVQTNCAVIQ